MKNVIAGLEEGLQAIAEALEADSIVPTPAAADEGKVLTAGDDGTASWETPEGGIPTPTLSDEGKVLKAVPQTQTTVAPEWAPVNEVPIGGQNGQEPLIEHRVYKIPDPVHDHLFRIVHLVVRDQLALAAVRLDDIDAAVVGDVVVPVV